MKYGKVISFILPLVIIIIWSLASAFNLINIFYIPSVSDFFDEFLKIIYLPNLNINILKSLERLFIGFTIGLLIGFPTGLMMGASKRIYKLLELLVEIFRSIPVASLFPLFLLFFGIDDLGKYMIVAWSTSFIILINTMYGVKHVKELRKLVAKNFKTNKIQLFTKIIIPESLPDVFIGLRQGISIALIVVIVAEMFMGTEKGLGVLIQNSALTYDTATMYAAIILTGLIGYFLNKLIILLENNFLPWVGK